MAEEVEGVTNALMAHLTELIETKINLTEARDRVNPNDALLDAEIERVSSEISEAVAVLKKALRHEAAMMGLK